MALSTDEKLVNQLADQIQQKIVTGEYRPGEKLKQVALANTFQVSRTPIRQALSQLAARGIVDQSQTGAVVKSQSSKDVRDIYRVRSEVEGLAAQLAAQWITDQQLLELRKIHTRFVHAVTELSRLRAENPSGHTESAGYQAARQEWVSSNSEFHAIIFQASCNAFLGKIIADLQLGSARGRIASSALGMYKHRMERNIAHHEAILSALEAHDEIAARRAMAAHVDESGEFVATWMENQSQTQ
ncbi:GntR family transcriptional regulator [Ottowia thiooxydans]|uniref:DNA-binding GntR family transcriptional regulator n=1 Tax=Ottowia thiooxydans TaxID=219182 RepID=A0ABV2QFF1_9BURK